MPNNSQQIKLQIFGNIGFTLFPGLTLFRFNSVLFLISISAFFVTSDWGHNVQGDRCPYKYHQGSPVRSFPPLFCCNGSQISQIEIPQIDEAHAARFSISHHSDGYLRRCPGEVSPALTSDNISVYLVKNTICSPLDK